MKQPLLHAATLFALLGLTACSGPSAGAVAPSSTAMGPGGDDEEAAASAPDAVRASSDFSRSVPLAASPSGNSPHADSGYAFESLDVKATATTNDSYRIGFAAAAKPAPPQAPPPPPVAKPTPTLSPGDPSAKSTAGEIAAVRAPLLVYTAQITVAVFEVAASLAQVESLGRELGGFLARRDDRTITIRIPAGRFDEALKRLEKVGDMLHRNVTAEDVTEEFRDLEVRLKSAHAVQERLTQLLAKAMKVEESVMIERELDRVTGEIDRIEGRMKFLRDRSALSTITVTFSSKSRETLSQGPFRLPSPWLQQLGLGRLLRL